MSNNSDPQETPNETPSNEKVEPVFLFGVDQSGQPTLVEVNPLNPQVASSGGARVGSLKFTPSRVNFAGRIVQLFLDAKTPSVYDDKVVDGSAVELDRNERAVYNAALELLRNYFSGEIDCGDYPVNRRKLP